MANLTIPILLFTLVLNSIEGSNHLESASEPESFGSKTGFSLEEKCVGCHNAYVGQFPYIASVFLNGGEICCCTGTIISEWDVLTAKHCIFSDDVFVVAGVVAPLSEEGEETEWRQLRIPEDIYEHPTADIAIIRLSDPFHIISEYVSPLPITSSEPNASTLTNPMAVGYGLDTADPFRVRLRYSTQVQFVSDIECHNREINSGIGQDFSLDPETELCIDMPKGLGVCYGDSGSPLVSFDFKTRFSKAVGVLSRGLVLDCAVGEPDIYVSIAAHKDWIRDHSKGHVDIII